MRPEKSGTFFNITESSPVLLIPHSAFLLFALTTKTHQAVGITSLSLLGLGFPGQVARVVGLVKGGRAVNA